MGRLDDETQAYEPEGRGPGACRISAGWRLGPVPGEAEKPLQNGTAVRDLRGMLGSRRSLAPTQATKHGDLQVLHAGGGTRTPTRGL